MHISLTRVTKSFRRLTALDAVSLEIEPGQIVAVLGANGAGKTTLLNCLGAVYIPTSGSIHFDQQPFERSRLDLRQRLALLPDFPFVHTESTVLQHIASLIRIYEAEQRSDVSQRVLKLLEDFDLLPLAEMTLKDLSRGQVYKSALAAVMAVDPELWMFDEPFASGMDPRGLTAFRRYCREAAERGRTILYTTQLLELAEEFSDRVCIINQGRVHAFDSIAALRAPEQEHGRVLEEIFERLERSTP